MIRKEQIEYPKKLENENYEDIGDPEILSRMSQYEMAYRMQTSVPEVMDVSMSQTTFLTCM